MTHEPTHYHTVAIRPCMPPKSTRTLADYQASIIARYGKMPSMAELARKERGPSTMRAYVPPADTSTAIAMRAATVAKGEATRTSIMAALTVPMTCPEVANAVSRTQQLIHRHLLTLEAEGRVKGTKVKGITVWERA